MGTRNREARYGLSRLRMSSSERRRVSSRCRCQRRLASHQARRSNRAGGVWPSWTLTIHLGDHRNRICLLLPHLKPHDLCPQKRIWKEGAHRSNLSRNSRPSREEGAQKQKEEHSSRHRELRSKAEWTKCIPTPQLSTIKIFLSGFHSILTPISTHLSYILYKIHSV